MADAQYVVLAQWDPELSIWFVKASDIPGLFVETPTFEEFVEVVRDLAPDLLSGEDEVRLPISIAIKADMVTLAEPSSAAAA